MWCEWTINGPRHDFVLVGSQHGDGIFSGASEIDATNDY